jgi:hypothetical protein
LIATVVAVALYSLRRTAKEDGVTTLDSLPAHFFLMLLLYSCLPPISWLLGGGEENRTINSRLGIGVLLDEQIYLVAMTCVFAISVAFGASIVRKKLRKNGKLVPVVPGNVLLVCIGIVLLDTILLRGLVLTGFVPQAESYLESYRITQQLPLPLRIVLKLTGGFGFFAKATILVWLFQNWRTHRYWVFAIGIITLISFNPEAGRSSTFLFFYVCLILWNRFISRISLMQLSLCGVLMIAAFSAAGTYRGLNKNVDFDLERFDLNLGEFDAIWTNAIVLLREKRLERLVLPAQIHFSELYGPIPEILLPFEKWNYSGWFLNTYYRHYGRSGGGLMFGVTAQLVIGFGWAEVIIRGVLLGWFLERLTLYFRNGSLWWHYPSLVYCSAWTFYTVRDSSFSLITNLFQVLALGVLTIEFLGKFIRIVPKEKVAAELPP